MNAGKRIDVGASSLVDLKAELYRKQQEFAAQKASVESGQKFQRPAKSKPIWERQNAGVEERAAKDVEQQKEDAKTYEKAKAALEAKSKLYDKLSKNVEPVGEDGPQYLVDFERKAYDSRRERQEDTSDDIPPPSCPEEEWVEYTDSFGRTRTCLRRDLEEMKALEKTAEERWRDLEAADTKREELRKKWEKEEEEIAKKGKVHYQDVLFDEARAHGVGYFGFSRDEETRKEQMVQLEQLRSQTEQQKVKYQRLKDKRKMQMDARLKKVRERKRLRLGLPLEESDEEKDEPTVEVNLDTIPLPLPKPVEPQPVKTDVVRPWDIGKPGVIDPKKKKVFNERSWLEGERKQRKEEFAPPSSYYDVPSGRVPATSSSASDVSPQHTVYIRNEVVEGSSSSSDEDEDVTLSTRGSGAEFAPPATYEYYGPTTGRRQTVQHSNIDIEKSISAGLSFLRQEAEKKNAKSDKGLMDFI